MSRNEVGIIGVFSAEIRFASTDEKSFERALAIDESSNHTAMRWGLEFQNHDVPIQNVRSGHGITTHFEGKGAGVFWDSQRVEIHPHAALALLALTKRMPCGDGSQNRNLADQAIGGFG